MTNVNFVFTVYTGYWPVKYTKLISSLPKRWCKIKSVFLQFCLTSLVVHKWHISPLVSVIAWDNVVTEPFSVWSFATLFAHKTHFSEFSYYGLSKTVRCAFINSSAIFPASSFQNRKVASLSWADSDWTPLRFVSVAPSYKSTCHLRLKISYCPIQRPLCGKACVCRLGVAYSSVLDSGCIICPSLIWWFLWCFCSQDESLSFWSR